MIHFLARLFIRDAQNTADPRVRAAYGRLCSICAILLNLLLFAAKFYMGRRAGSLSVTADAVNNLTDALSALLLFLGFWLASRKPSSSHPFGHGRVEYVTGLAVSVLILLTAVELGRSSLEKLLHPQVPEFSWLAAAVLLLSMAVKLSMASFTRRCAGEIGSAAMEAAAADYRSDIFASGAALLALLCQHFFDRNLDGWGGLLVSLVILRTGIGSARDTLGQLLGRPPEREQVEAVEAILRRFPEILGFHDMIIHDYGPGRLYVSVHAEVDGNENLYALHDAMDRAMAALDEALGCESVIHMDPVDTRDARAAALREDVAALVQAMDEKLSIHDFRVVPGGEYSRLFFDVMAPHGYKSGDEALQRRIAEAVEECHPGYRCMIKIDHSYI